MNIVQNAKKHFQDRIGDDLKFIEVPEWGDESGPAKIYYKACMSLQSQNQINKYAKDGSLEALAEILIVRALDEGGNKVFRKSNKTDLMSFIDPEVITRICTEMSEDDITLEDAEGN